MTFRVRPDATVESMTRTLGLIAVKVRQLNVRMEVHRGDDFFTKDEKELFQLIYKIAHRHFTDDNNPEFDKLYGDDEL